MVDVNVTHVIMMTKLFVEKLIKREKKSAIINVGSTVGYNVMSGNAVYCATKAAVMYFTEAIGIELKGKIDI